MLRLHHYECVSYVDCYFKKADIVQYTHWNITRKNHEVIFPVYVGLVKPVLETHIWSEVLYFKKNVEKLEREQNITQSLVKELENRA